MKGIKSFWDKNYASILYAVLLIPLSAAFFIFMYADIKDTLDNSIVLGRAIHNGEFFHYYEYAVEHASRATVYTANYNVLVYLIFAIWNLPILLLYKFTGLDYMNSVGALLWCKGIIVASFLLIAVVMKKICNFLGKDKREAFMGFYLTISSVCAFISAFVAVQYDCIALAVTLWGIYFYLKDDKKLFLLFFSLAIPLKLFALFIFIPLVLLKQKNILKILMNVVMVYIPNLLLGMLFHKDYIYQMAIQSQNKDAINLLISTGVTGGIISFFILLYCLLCVYCYTYKADEREDFSYTAIYVSAAVYVFFVIFVPIRSYWIILYVPFLALVLALSSKDKIIGLLLDTVGALFGGLYILANHWIYNTDSLCRQLLLKQWKLSEGMELKFGTFQNLLDQAGLLQFKFVFFTIFAACMLSILFIYRPEKENITESKRNTKYENMILGVRPVLLMGIVLLLLFASFAERPQLCYGSQNMNATKMEENILEHGVADRRVEFAEDKQLSEFGIMLTTNAGRDQRVVLTFELYDKTEDMTVWKDELGICLIKSGQYHVFEMDQIPVYEGHEYYLKIDRKHTERKGGAIVQLHHNEFGETAIYFR